MHTETVGSGRPIVILHGWRLDSTVELADLEPVFMQATGWRRHYVDMPGMGRSSPPLSEAALPDYVRYVREAIRELVGDDPYALAGTSAGALIARVIAGFPDEQVAGLLLRMPLVESNRSRRRVPRGAAAEISVRASRARAQKRADLWEPAERRIDPSVQALRDDPKRYRLDLPTDVLRVPALVISGRQDTRAGWRDALKLLETLPHATFAAIDDAEHEFPWSDNRELFAVLVLDWLRRTDANWPR
jgi:pimeloyl-ACP methyl ester carboxylesterase